MEGAQCVLIEYLVFLSCHCLASIIPTTTRQTQLDQFFLRLTFYYEDFDIPSSTISQNASQLFHLEIKFCVQSQNIWKFGNSKSE